MNLKPPSVPEIMINDVHADPIDQIMSGIELQDGTNFFSNSNNCSNKNIQFSDSPSTQHSGFDSPRSIGCFEELGDFLNGGSENNQLLEEQNQLNELFKDL